MRKLQMTGVPVTSSEREWKKTAQTGEGEGELVEAYPARRTTLPLTLCSGRGRKILGLGGGNDEKGR